MDQYIDRRDAGRILAKMLQEYAGRQDVIALALPRGGVPVAYEIASALAIPLEVFIVRKLGLPQNEEYAMGAIASGGIVILNEALIHERHIKKPTVEQVINLEEKELRRREFLYQIDKNPKALEGKTILLIDDGIATGSSMKVAIMAIRQQHPAQIIIAVPVASAESCDEISRLVEHVICPLKPLNFRAVGLWYENFAQTSDSEVCELLNDAKQMRQAPILKPYQGV